MSQSFDTVVIGGGPGGYVCAIRAAQLGQNVAVIEREHLGGICLNWGCIPTKALLKSSEVYRTFQHSKEYGFSHNGVSIHMDKIVSRSRNVADKLSNGIGFLLKKNKVTVIEGEASFKNKTTLTVDKKGKKSEVTFKNVVIATGARARQIPGVLEADGKNIWTYRDALASKEQPKSLLVIGAGAIGVEFASFYATLGSKVTVVEALDRLVPIEDKEISKQLEKSFKKDGIDIQTATKTISLKDGKGGVKVVLEKAGKKTESTFDKVLLAIGVQGNVENLGIEKLGIVAERGNIKTDKFYRTNIENIYAIGDVAGAPWLAHVASHEGVICAETIAGRKAHPMNYDNIPGCTYCTPQIASTGLTEEKAREQGYEVKVGHFNYQANGKALAIGENEGFVKTIFDEETGALLGAHIIGAEATEMISTFVVARQMEATEEDLIQSCLPHPTLSEMIGESVLDSENRVIHA
jgi:dihydrolipoamide dehydrogenase